MNTEASAPRTLNGHVALVTGAANGIGAATAAMLRERGARVIGVDLREGDIAADLSTPAGRDEMVAKARALAPGGLDLVAACAGVSRTYPDRIIPLNYFGALATLEGLRPLLAMREIAHAIAIASVAAIADTDEQLVAACSSGDEPAAIRLAEAMEPPRAYNSSKRALSLWVRRTATRPEWGDSAICLNAIAPGFVRTQMTERLIGDEAALESVRKMTPRIVDHVAEPWVIAEVIASIAALRGDYLLGQVLFVDGGSDALLRPDTF